MLELDGLIYIDPKEELTESERIGKDISGLEEYGLVEVRTRRKLAGHFQKRFVKLSSWYFSKYINEIVGNPNSSYETYLDNNDIRSGIVPKNFSVLIKQDVNYYAEMNGSENKILGAVLAELCVPAIMNEIGVKTVYNSVLVESDGYLQYIMSIDAIKPDEELFSLEEFVSCNFAGWIGSSFDIVREYVSHLFVTECGVDPKELKTEKYQKIFKDLMDEFIVRYLANVLVLGNNDFNTRNCAVVVNRKTMQIRFFPCFDYELCFNKVYLYDLVYDNLRVINKMNPRLLKDFCKRVKSLITVQKSGKTRLKEVIENSISDFGEKDYFEQVVIKNIEDFLDVYNKVLGDEKSVENQLTIF